MFTETSWDAPGPKVVFTLRSQWMAQDAVWIVARVVNFFSDQEPTVLGTFERYIGKHHSTNLAECGRLALPLRNLVEKARIDTPVSEFVKFAKSWEKGELDVH